MNDGNFGAYRRRTRLVRAMEEGGTSAAVPVSPFIHASATETLRPPQKIEDAPAADNAINRLVVKMQQCSDVMRWRGYGLQQIGNPATRTIYIVGADTFVDDGNAIIAGACSSFINIILLVDMLADTLRDELDVMADVLARLSKDGTLREVCVCLVPGITTQDGNIAIATSDQRLNLLPAHIYRIAHYSRINSFIPVKQLVDFWDVGGGPYVPLREFIYATLPRPPPPTLSEPYSE